MNSTPVIRCKACDATVDTKTARAEGSTTCPKCGATLSVFADDTDAPRSAAAAMASASQSLSELQIPGYEIRQQIGRGGMGFVFEARQTSLDRSVAIKVLAPHLSNDPQFAKRFDAEAAALARLSHPNIVSIYERGRCGERLFFVMEFVAGDAQGRPADLKGLIARGPLGNDKARRLIVQVMQALSVAHAEGIVHRDIKPGNILLDRHGNAKVADFGIACIGDTPDGERYTQPAAAMGTYDYMAPEQRADAAKSDARADIYSTAVMLYEMLTGSLPAGAFQPPSVARPGVHAAWDAIVARGMHPLREERFPTMAAFASAVEAISFGDAVPVPDGRTTSTALASMRCHECEQPVREDAQYCPACRSPQFLDCAKCGARMRVALNGCEQCGADLQTQRKYERFCAIGRTALERARIAGVLSDRIQAAQEAGMAFARARKATNDDSAVAPLLTEANRIVETLATEAIQSAVREKRFGEAITLLDALLDVAPGRVDAERIRTRLISERNQALSEATRLRDAGRPAEAVRILSDLAGSFANDGQVNELLRDCERRASGLKAVVRDTMPGLIAEKKWCAVESLVRQLEAEKAQVAGLGDLATRVEMILGSVRGAIAQAEAALEAGNYTLTLRVTDAVLEKVIDHPRAIELRSIATSSLEDVRDKADRLKGVLEQSRWFAARQALWEIPTGLRSRPGIADAVRRTDAGIENANRYATLIAIVVGASVATLAACVLAGGLGEGLTNALQAFRVGADVFGHNWLTGFTLLAMWMVAGVGGVVAAATVCHRPVGQAGWALGIAIVPVFCLAALCCVAPHEWDSDLETLIEKVREVSPVGMPALTALKSLAANACVWFGYSLAVAICLTAMQGLSGAPALRPAIIAGGAATLTTLYGHGYAPRYGYGESSTAASGVSIAILIAAVTVLAGRGDRRSYVASMIGAGLVMNWLVGLLHADARWLAPVLLVGAILAVQAVFTRPRSMVSWLAEAALVLTPALGARYLGRSLVRVSDVICIAPDAVIVAVVMVAGLLARRWAVRKQIDRHLYVAERFATRQWSPRPSSTVS